MKHTVHLMTTVLAITLLGGCSISEYRYEGQAFNIPGNGRYYSQYYIQRVIVDDDNAQTSWPICEGRLVKENFNYADLDYRADKAVRPVIAQIVTSTQQNHSYWLKLSNLLGFLSLSVWPHNCFADRYYSVRLLDPFTLQPISESQFKIHRWHSVHLACLNYLFTDDNAHYYLDYFNDQHYEYQVISDAIMQDISSQNYKPVENSTQIKPQFDTK